MKELNQTIKKFYEHMYRTEVKTQSNSYYYVDSSEYAVIFLAFRGELIKTLVKNAAPSWTSFAGQSAEYFDRFDDEEIVYMFNTGPHTEEEMLRLIKMKAFL